MTPNDELPVGLRKPWAWVQPANHEEFVQRLLEAREYAVPERERENLCSMAYEALRHRGPKLRVERGEAVNLARNWLDKDSGGWAMHTYGIRLLADAVMRMDAALLGGPKGELRVLFDGPPSHESGRFVECEDASGNGVNAGEWRERPDKLWELVITTLPHATQGSKT